jgi:predicted RNA methylase
MARIIPGDRVCDPSAGTGRLLDAARDEGAASMGIEIDARLCDRLRRRFSDVTQADFLDVSELGGADVVIMNPPFKDGADIKHILHAFSLLRTGGRLVAICADGPRQQKKLKPWALGIGGTWESLPGGTFAEAGTSVRSALLCVEKSPA